MDTPLKMIIVPLGEAQLTVPETVLVRTFLQQYAKPECSISAQLERRKVNRPRIGERGLYGTYAGVSRGIDGADDAIIEVLGDVLSVDRITWQEALKWAESVGGTLPTRREAALLYANVPELFEQAYYWTCEQIESGPDFAWVQSFFDGGPQYDDHKSNHFRARAVRRLPLSVIR